MSTRYENGVLECETAMKWSVEQRAWSFLVGAPSLLALLATLLYTPLIIHECASIRAELELDMAAFAATTGQLWRELRHLEDSASKRLRRQLPGRRTMTLAQYEQLVAQGSHFFRTRLAEENRLL